MELPKHYDFKESERRWQEFWEREKIYAFDAADAALDKAEGEAEGKNERSREIFSIDTPPPTVSGKMHIGHSFSYSQQDFIARFQRMRGKNVFYPFGTDDNGVPTERLVEKLKKVRSKSMPRKEFVKLCLETIEKELRPQYVSDWKRLGMSCDFSIFYTTINEHCQRISQREFINLHRMGRAYRKDAPAMWCPECQTGISQVECEDKELSSFFNDIIFTVSNGISEEKLIIATTRPELLPACVAVFYHPEDTRYIHLKGKTAKVPLFELEVPIMEDARADPEKGTGIVMCCTFGDQTDMEWQKAHNLPIKEAITIDGKMTQLAGKYSGFDIKTARKMILEDMKAQGLLVGQKPIQHAVKVHERCGVEVEIIKSKQWFIKYLDLKEDMLEWGQKLKWHPEHMRHRYDNWVNGLQWDWLISRQRFFGIPFPVWYCKKCDEPIFAKIEELPVDPLNDNPPIKTCPKCGSTEFAPEKDVLDTWTTSSLTPQLSVELMPASIQAKLFPMTLRPQAQDIITFWLFNTTFRSNIHFGANPWRDCMISGWALDPHGKKMSKSKGNVIEPQLMMDKFGTDALRFWAASSKLGENLPVMEKDFVTAQKTTTKLWNASKFVLMNLEDYAPAESFSDKSSSKLSFDELALLDKWLLTKLSKTIEQSTTAFEEYEYSKAKATAEKFFWQVFCDNYLEFVKHRTRLPEQDAGSFSQESKRQAQFCLYNSLLSILKLFAPFMPHITEEIYQLRFADEEKKKSIHISDWPLSDSFENISFSRDEHAEFMGDLFVEIIGAVRKYKSSRNVSLKQELQLVTVSCPEHMQQKAEELFEDLKKIANAKEVKFGYGDIVCSEHVKIGIDM